MSTLQIIELGVSAVVFALCLAGFLHTRSLVKSGDSGGKKLKKRKKLFFAGMLVGAWVAVGVLISAFSGIKGGLKMEFSMFSERTQLFGLSIAKTTITASCVVLVISLLAVLFRAFVFPRFKDAPRGLQNVIELCVESIEKYITGIVGEKSSAFLSPYMFSLALFLIGCASVELLGLRAPTSDLTVTFAMGLLTFILLNVLGVRRLGFAGRLKSMGGPVAPMRVIMIPLKIVSDIAVPVSLACRLFGNMLGGMIVMELLKGALGGYGTGIPALAGLYFNLFHPLIQAYIFITLSLTFIEEASEPVIEEKKSKEKHKQKYAADAAV